VSSKVRLLIGSLAGTAVVYIVAFLFWGTSLSEFVRSSASARGDSVLVMARWSLPRPKA